MKKMILMAATALALGACGGGDEATVNETDEPVDALLPGNFEITTEVTDLASTDDGTPATAAEIGAVTTTNVCVGEDGLLPAAVFGEDGDDCTIENPYVKRGRMRQELVCQREGRGEVRAQVAAEFEGESIEGDIRTSTFFSGDGDYNLVRTIRGQRTGDCTEEEAEEELEADVAE